MFHKIKLWWYTSILKKVVYKPDGKPYDCHGLRYKGTRPFGEDTIYYITRDYGGFIYIGKGCYCSPRSVLSDHKNPYWMEIFMKQLKVYKE